MQKDHLVRVLGTTAPLKNGRNPVDRLPQAFGSRPAHASRRAHGLQGAALLQLDHAQPQPAANSAPLFYRTVLIAEKAKRWLRSALAARHRRPAAPPDRTSRRC